LLLALGGAAVAAVAGWQGWRAWHAPQPPAVDPSEADPEVLAALESFRGECRRSPHSPQAWGKLGNALLAHDFHEAAQVCFARAEALDPADVRWPYLLGLTTENRDAQASLAHWQRALRLGGEVPIIRLRLAELLLKQDRLEEAEDHYRRLRELEPQNGLVQLGLARLAYRRGQWQVAREHLTPLLQGPFTRRKAHSLLAQVELRLHNPAAAARAGAQAQALPEDPGWPDPFLEESDRLKTGRRARLALALRLFNYQRPAEAHALFLELERRYPEWDEIWVNHGRILLAGHRLTEAEYVLRRALTLAPDSVRAHYYLGLVLLERGSHGAAATEFREATRLKPDHARAYFNLGLCLKAQGDRAAALGAFARAAECQPNHAPAHVALGELLAERGETAEAIKRFRMALDLNPNEPTAKESLARLEKRLRQE
jgi:tetratricopeptide (TPR) repeat protein